MDQQTLNFLPTNKFELTIERLMKTSFMATSCNVPGMSAQVVNQATPFKMLARGGDKVDFNPLNVTFKVDENFDNFIEIYNWINGITFPVNFDQFGSYLRSNDSITSDATLVVLNSANNPNVIFRFKNLFPFSLSDIEFVTTDTQTQFAQATVNCIYDYYTIERAT